MNSIPKENAHPNFDHADRIALFHNGNIANYSDLKASLTLMGIKIPKSQDINDLTDSQLITALIGWELDNNKTLKEALKNVVEKKLLGTY